ncbi:MAG TPA: glycosyltransferase N-terminal domain-containing protein, partial [Synergistales bacterium]|nr:glycosyltransferase N-terminal domain-containing protein [Synergistales bacterium]
MAERRGLYSEEKKGRLPEEPLWFHAVSVGEVQSAWPLLKILAREGAGPEGILLSTTTTTGREMAYRVAGGLFHEHLYYPWDIPWIVRRALDHRLRLVVEIGQIGLGQAAGRAFGRRLFERELDAVLLGQLLGLEVEMAADPEAEIEGRLALVELLPGQE